MNMIYILNLFVWKMSILFLDQLIFVVEMGANKPFYLAINYNRFIIVLDLLILLIHWVGFH
jgi:hypothetical protein